MPQKVNGDGGAGTRKKLWGVIFRKERQEQWRERASGYRKRLPQQQNECKEDVRYNRDGYEHGPFLPRVESLEWLTVIKASSLFHLMSPSRFFRLVLCFWSTPLRCFGSVKFTIAFPHRHDPTCRRQGRESAVYTRWRGIVHDASGPPVGGSRMKFFPLLSSDSGCVSLTLDWEGGVAIASLARQTGGVSLVPGRRAGCQSGCSFRQAPAIFCWLRSCCQCPVVTFFQRNLAPSSDLQHRGSSLQLSPAPSGTIQQLPVGPCWVPFGPVAPSRKHGFLPLSPFAGRPAASVGPLIGPIGTCPCSRGASA